MITKADLASLRSQAEFMALSGANDWWRKLADALAELEDSRKGECICTHCGLRQPGEPVTVEF